jgi:tetratricopeptide (TPR) repeat protein
MIASVLCFGAAHGAGTHADRLLAYGSAPATALPAQIKQEVYALLAQMNVPQSTRKQFELMHHWDVKAFPPGARTVDMHQAIVVASGPISVPHTTFAVIIAAGDVDIASGAEIIVISGGNIRFSHHPRRERSGVFVAKGRFDAPWVVDAAIHAGKGAQLTSNSLAVHAFNTSVRSKARVEVATFSGTPVFSGSPRTARRRASPKRDDWTEIRFAGQRCTDSAPLATVADNVPRMARSKAQCAHIDAVLVSCSADGSEQWTVHICKNIIVDIRSRMSRGRAEFDYYNPLVAKARIGITSDLRVTTHWPKAVHRVVPRENSEVDALVTPLFKEVTRLREEKRRDEAIAVLEKILEIDPWRPIAHSVLVDLKRQRGDDRGALEHLDRYIIMLDPASPFPETQAYTYGRRGLLLLSLGERTRGLADLDHSVRLAPRDWIQRQHRGLGRFYAGDFDEAIEDFDFVSKTVKQAGVFEHRGWSYFLKRQPREACEDALRSLASLKETPPNAGTPAQAAYSLMLGHFACAQASETARIEPFFDEWRSRLPAKAWPEAFISYLRGEVGEPELRAASTYPHRAGEIDAFLGLDAQKNGRDEEALKRFQQAIAGAKGYNLARALGEHFVAAQR